MPSTLRYVFAYVKCRTESFSFCSDRIQQDPLKSATLLFGLIPIWLFFCFVPTRWIVLVLGLVCLLCVLQLVAYSKFSHVRFQAQYIVTLLSINGFLDGPVDQDEKPSPIGSWLLNAFRGIPTGEDLRKTYFWDVKQSSASKIEEFKSNKRAKRLKSLWKAHWYAPIRMLDNKLAWVPAFAILQGHQFIWWQSIDTFDQGASRIGSLFMAGHAGLATPSPSDLRAVAKTDVDRVVCLFGRGSKQQERLTLLAPTVELKKKLEEAITTALSVKRD